MSLSARVRSLETELAALAAANEDHDSVYSIDTLVLMDIANRLVKTSDEAQEAWLHYALRHNAPVDVDHVADFLVETVDGVLSNIETPRTIIHGLTKRWRPLRTHEPQRQLLTSKARFVTVPAGRRSGKTEAAKRMVVSRSIEAALSGLWDDARFICAAPTYAQAKKIYWNDLRRMIPRDMLDGKPSASELTIRLKGGVEILVTGMDVPERAEGSPLNGIVLDEFGNMAQSVWGEHIRPMLSEADRLGWAWFIGVPEGRNHYYELDRDAKKDTTGQWASFTWKSSEIVPASELAAARRDLDELTYAQEYEASFVTFEGRCYYPFNDGIHASRKLPYNPDWDLIFCFDFNVSPGVAVVAQEHPKYGTLVIGEVHIPNNSTTPAVCRKLIADWGQHRGNVYCYGDATGGNRGTAKLSGSDWDIIKAVLTPGFGGRLKFRVPKQNGPERSRVNAVNSRLMSVDKTVRLWVDPIKAPKTVQDLEGVRLLKGSAGEIDKKADEKLTHLTDALGYYIVHEFPVTSRKVISQEF